MTSDGQLLARYVANHSREAFAELAARYLDMVYAAARRQVGGDTALAEDLTQGVFLMLARKAPALRADVILPGWLLRATWYAARNAMRQQQRRRLHEARVAAMNSRAANSSVAESSHTDIDDGSSLSAFIDRALMSLRERDRAAVAMHYLRGQNLEEVAAALRTTPEGARKRIERAMQKLRERFASASAVTSVTPAAVISALASAANVHAPPTLLAAVKSSVTAAPASAVAAMAAGGLRAMALAKTRHACAVLLAAAICTAGIAVTRRSNLAATDRAATTPAMPATAPESSAPLVALNRLAAAVRAGDGEAAKSLVAVSNPADWAFLNLAAENIRLAGVFKSTYLDAFGPAAGDALPRDWYPTTVPADAPVRITGDRATVQLREGSVPVVRVDGRWKVPSSFVTIENQGSWPTSSPQALELARLNNIAYAETTRAIVDGRWKSPEQARADLRDRLARAKVLARAAAATHPQTQPARR
jgi:RNA polymerase sigma factor (sigma-70 family)